MATPFDLRKASTRASSATAAIVTRGAGIEATHAAAIAVVDAHGRLTHHFGDPELVVFARSSIKPFQALALCRSGARERFGIDDEELAIACASHSGSDEHVRVVRRLLDKAGAGAEDLGCGAHWPIGMRLAGRHPCAGEDTDPLRHNCSGKHAGFLAVARALGEAREGYLEPDSMVQRLVRSGVAEACELAEDTLVMGVDGCSAPNYAMALSSLARAAKNLGLAGISGAARDLGLSPLRHAVQHHPLLVSGEARFDAELAAAFPHTAIAKGGAEGVQIVGFSDPPLGIAIKILDGAERAVAPVTVAVLSALGIIGSADVRLASRARPPVKNMRGLVTGEIVPVLELATAPGR